MVQLIIYTTPTCQFCKMTKAFFAEKGVPYEEKDVASDLEARQKMVQKIRLARRTRYHHR